MNAQQVPKIQLLLAAVGGGVVAVLLSAAVDAVSDDTVRTGRVEVVTPSGELRVVLGVGEDGRPMLWMHDDHGERVTLGVQSSDLVSLRLISTDGKVQTTTP